MSSSPQRNWLGIAVVVLVFMIVVSVVGYIWFPFAMFTEQRDAGEEIVRDEMDADEALQSYRWFRSQYQDIQAQRDQINNSYEADRRFHETYGNDSDTWDRQTKERHSRIQTRITGNQNALEQMVAEYNARSQDATRAVFKCQLPYQVDERFGITGPPGSDAPEQPQDEYLNGTSAGEPPQAEQCDSLPSSAEQ